MSRNKITTSEWLELLGRQQCTENPPEGWKTIKEIATELGLSTVHTMKLIKQHDGRVETRQYRIQVGQRVMPVPHYKIKP